MPNPEETPCELKSDDSKRYQWISVAAYFKAESRCFVPGKELDDWLEAEIEYTECQIQAFLLRCQEDGCMTITSLQELAGSIGVANPRNITNETDLIREIQSATHHRPCFRTTYHQPCEDPEFECPWRAECQKIIAVWHR